MSGEILLVDKQVSKEIMALGFKYHSHYEVIHKTGVTINVSDISNIEEFIDRLIDVITRHCMHKGKASLQRDIKRLLDIN